MFRRSEKQKLFSRSFFFACAMALVMGCAVDPVETEQSTLPDPVESTQAQESALAVDDNEAAVCELEVDCCGNLNCAPAPCPVFCI